MDVVKTNLAQKLSELRGDRSLYKIQQGTGIDRSLIRRYEAGTDIPGDEILMKLAAFYNVDFQELKMLQLEDSFPDGSLSQEILFRWVNKKQANQGI